MWSSHLVFVAPMGNPFRATAACSVCRLNKSKSSSVATFFWPLGFPHSAMWWCQMVAAGVSLGVGEALWCAVFCPSCVDPAEHQPAVGRTAVPWESSRALDTSLRIPCCSRCCWMCTISQWCPGSNWHRRMIMYLVVFCMRLPTGFQTSASSVPGTTVQSGPLGETQPARI